jgi:hypothetical protein
MRLVSTVKTWLLTRIVSGVPSGKTGQRGAGDRSRLSTKARFRAETGRERSSPDVNSLAGPRYPIPLRRCSKKSRIGRLCRRAAVNNQPTAGPA